MTGPRTMLALALLLIALPVRADIYKWVDADGGVHLSNVQPEWWQDAYDEMDYNEIVAPDEAASLYSLEDSQLRDHYALVGDIQSKLYYDLKCEKAWDRSGDEPRMIVPAVRRAYFKTVYSARRAGFEPAPECVEVEASGTPAPEVGEGGTEQSGSQQGIEWEPGAVGMQEGVGEEPGG